MKKMRGVLEKIRGKGSRNSLLAKTFISLLILALLMVLIIGVWMNRIAVRNQRQQVAQANLARLEQAGETMQLMVDTLGENMTQVMWGSDCITYMILPEQGNSEKTYRVIRQLSSAVSGNNLVDAAFFYSPFSGKIIDSDYLVTDAEQYWAWDIIEEHYKGTQYNGEVGSGRTVITLFQWEDEWYLIADLEIPNRLGSLVYRLNSHEIGRSLNLLNEDGGFQVYVYDREHEPVFTNLGLYSDWTPKWGEANYFIAKGNSYLAEDITRGCYSYSNPKSGWIYLMPMDTKQLTVSLKDMAAMYLPISVLFLVISSVFAYYISRSIYQPINRLMNLVANTGTKSRKGSSKEIDFLESAYSDAMNRQEHLTGIIESIGPEILDSMLYNLLHRKYLTEQRVGEILDGVGNPIPLNGRFVVFACRILLPNERPITETELNLYLLSLRKFAERTDSPERRVYYIRSGRFGVALLASYSAEFEDVQKDAIQIRQNLLRDTANIPCEIRTEISGIYSKLMDLSTAFQEADGRLQYQQYLAQDERSRGTDTETVSADMEELEEAEEFVACRERMKNIADLAAQGDCAQAEKTIQLLFDEIGQKCTSDEAYRRNIAEAVDSLTEHVIVLPLSEADQNVLNSARSIMENIHRDSPEMETKLKDYLAQLIRMIRFYSGKNRYKYVEQAKEYLAENYSDSNLSLGSVGEKIGISGSYLSELFTEVTGEKFSSYLAAFRVNKARQLLSSTTITIKEIGFLCGFNSIQNFIRVFKKYTGATPGQYREEQK